VANRVKAGEGRLDNVRLAGGGFDHAILLLEDHHRSFRV